MSFCPECGREFVKTHPGHLYCTPQCGKAYRRRHPMSNDPSVTFVCAKCGRVVVTEPERGDRRTRFCSAECEKRYWRHPETEGRNLRNYRTAGEYFQHEKFTNEHF